MVGLLVGVSLLVLLIAWQEVGSIIDTIRQAGWGALLVCLFALPTLVLGGEGWRRLFPSGQKPDPGRTWWAWSVGYSVNALLPMASIGGEAAKVRMFTFWGRSIREVLSTIVVDRAMQAVAMLFWGQVGLVMLTALAPDKTVVIPGLIGSVLMAMGIGAFMAIQIKGGFSFLISRSGKLMRKEKRDEWHERAADMDQTIRSIYRRRGALAVSSTYHLAEKVVLVGEVMLASHLVGHPLGLGEAILIRGIVDALRLVAFFVPGGLGVQEGAFMAIGTILGIPPYATLALSLVTRVREILPSIPMVVYFQIVEGRRLLAVGDAKAD